MNPETIGPYRILEPLREGGVSSVYKAVGPAGAPVALKVFSTRVLAAPPGSAASPPSSPASRAGDLVGRFHREVRAVVPLSHPNILQVLETGEDGDRLYIATELFAGVSLERLLKERRRGFGARFRAAGLGSRTAGLGSGRRQFSALPLCSP